MTEALVGAVIGGLVAGWRGLVIGALVGYVVGWVRRRQMVAHFGTLHAQFVDSTFAVMGAISKADDVVTRDEIRAAENLFARLRLSAAQREAAKAAFGRGKSAGFDIDAEVAKFRRAAGRRPALLQLFLQAQLMAVGADGALHPREHAMLVRVARGLGLPEAAVAQLEALLRVSAGAQGAPYGSYGRGGYSGEGYGREYGWGANRRGADGRGSPPPSPRDKLADAYAALGLSQGASDAEIKRTYRRLMSQNHPDKLAAKGMPESMREIAEQKTREISAAYRLIKEARPSL